VFAQSFVAPFAAVLKENNTMAKQTPFNKIVEPTERESLLMAYATVRRCALTYRYRASALMRAGKNAANELKWARQDAAECRKIWKEIQAL